MDALDSNWKGKKIEPIHIHTHKERKYICLFFAGGVKFEAQVVRVILPVLWAQPWLLHILGDTPTWRGANMRRGKTRQQIIIKKKKNSGRVPLLFFSLFQWKKKKKKIIRKRTAYTHRHMARIKWEVRYHLLLALDVAWPRGPNDAFLGVEALPHLRWSLHPHMHFKAYYVNREITEKKKRELESENLRETHTHMHIYTGRWVEDYKTRVVERDDRFAGESVTQKGRERASDHLAVESVSAGFHEVEQWLRPRVHR